MAGQLFPALFLPARRKSNRSGSAYAEIPPQAAVAYSCQWQQSDYAASRVQGGSSQEMPQADRNATRHPFATTTR